MTAKLHPAKRFLEFCATALLLAATAAVAWSAPAGDGQDWQPIAQGGAVVELVTDSGPTTPAPKTNALRLSVKNLGHRAGMISGKGGEFATQAGQWYDLSFSAATEGNKHFALIFSLEDAEGKNVATRATLPEVGGAWGEFHLALQARQTAAHCRVVITLAETGTIWLDTITLAPRDKS